VGGQLVLHDQKSGAKLMSLTSDGPTKRAAQFGRTDAGALAAGLEDGSLALWDVRTRQVKQQLAGLHPVRPAVVQQQRRRHAALAASKTPAVQHVAPLRVPFARA
jgi:hypothetical protein